MKRAILENWYNTRAKYDKNRKEEQKSKEVPEEVIPVIDVYFDVSGSWYPEDIEIGQQAIATVKEFEDAGEIKLNIL